MMRWKWWFDDIGGGDDNRNFESKNDFLFVGIYYVINLNHNWVWVFKIQKYCCLCECM